ncbi:MAG: hypothetical protein Q9226_007784 [Calogaya cf. arnoldii]
MGSSSNTAGQVPSSSILALAKNILELTQDMTEYLQANSLAAPTFALVSPDPPDTPEYRRLHATLKTSLEDLSRLIDGPRKWLRAFCCTGYDLGALQVALDFEFFRLIPAHGELTIEELAKQSGLDADRTGRIIRQLMTYRFFDELRPRVISHSSTSLVMQQDEELRSVVHYSLDEMLKAAADCNVSLKANPHEAHQNLNPFLYPNLNFIVQDSNADMLAEGKVALSDDLRNRVTYQQHSFFDPQPTKDAAAFLIRQCTHNWADKDVVTIFKSFIPGLEHSSPDTPLLINDIIIPEPGTWPRHQERVVRQVDMVMLVNCGAKQRTKAEFESLLKEADPRYEIRNAFDDGPLGLLEIYLKRS